MYIFCVLISCLFFAGAVTAEKYEYLEGYIDQTIDHFNFVAHGNQTYKQRYLYNGIYAWWDKNGGPIFFYAGNEGDIVDLWNNNGFVIKAAKTFRALVVFVRKNNKSRFSLHYGGILVTYMRFKYPNIIQGSVAASAPIYQTAGKVSGDIFFQVITKDFHNVSPDCEGRVRSAFAQLNNWASLGPQGYAQISQAFQLCNPLKSNQDYDHFLRWIRNAFVEAAMGDFPYPSDGLPAFQSKSMQVLNIKMQDAVSKIMLISLLKVMCNLLQSALTPVEGLRQATALNYNISQTLNCFDIYKEFKYCADPTGCGLGFNAIAWDYQACTEINLEGSTDGVKDMFPVLPFTAAMRDEYCYKTYKVLPRRDYMDVQYWGADISSASNIVFSNGNLDPWAPGG
ncbi:dipeptidyl peptidase 2, partial [Caerostris extrusa]